MTSNFGVQSNHEQKISNKDQYLEKVLSENDQDLNSKSSM